MNDIMNNIVNDKKGHNIVNNNFAYKSDGLFVIIVVQWRLSSSQKVLTHMGIWGIFPC